MAGPREGTGKTPSGSGGKFREPMCWCPKATFNCGPGRAFGNAHALWVNLSRPHSEPRTQSHLCLLNSNTAPHVLLPCCAPNKLLPLCPLHSLPLAPEAGAWEREEGQPQGTQRDCREGSPEGSWVLKGIKRLPTCFPSWPSPGELASHPHPVGS